MTDQLKLALDGVTTWLPREFQCYLARCGAKIHEGSPHVMFRDGSPTGIYRMHPKCYIERCRLVDRQPDSAILLVCDQTMCSKCHKRLVPEGMRRVMTMLIADNIVRAAHEKCHAYDHDALRMVTELKP